MGGKSQTPAPQDPYQVAGAQTAGNQNTAAYNAALTRTNSYTPTGSHTYTNHGNDPTTGAPIYSEQTTLSPEQQGLYNSNTTNQLNSSGFAGQALGAARSAYQPINTDYQGNLQANQDNLYKSQSQYLDPQFARQESGMDAKLAAQGITPGSEAYKNAEDQFHEQKQQAYSNAQMNAINGATGQTGQQIQQGIALQNQPLNYYNSLMSGSQGSVPQFSGANVQQTSPANIQGAFGDAYTQQLNAANAQNASANQTTSTVGSLLGTALMAFSDERLKDDYGVIGETPAGVPVHVWNYKGDNQPQIGVMAQELEQINPDAVHTHASGYKYVDYGKVH